MFANEALQMFSGEVRKNGFPQCRAMEVHTLTDPTRRSSDAGRVYSGDEHQFVTIECSHMYRQPRAVHEITDYRCRLLADPQCRKSCTGQPKNGEA